MDTIHVSHTSTLNKRVDTHYWMAREYLRQKKKKTTKGMLSKN